VIDSADVELSGCVTRTPDIGSPIVQLDNVDRAFVHGCRANSDAPVFLQVNGARSTDIVLRGNHLLCEQPIVIGSSARSDAVWSDDPVRRAS